MSSHYTVGEVARGLGIDRPDLSNLIYRSNLFGEQCPVVSGRRLIPASLVPALLVELRRRNLITRERTDLVAQPA